MSTPTDKLDLIRKLLAKAEGASTEAEAEAYNVKASELMARYGVDEALLAASGERPDKIGQRRIYFDAPYAREKMTLLSYINRALGGKGVQHQTPRGLSLTIFGWESNLERVEMLYTSLLLQATAQVVHQHPTNSRYWTPSASETAAYRRSWLIGFSDAVYARLRRAESAAIHQHDAETHTTGTELVLVDRFKQVEKAFEETFTGLTSGRRRSLTGTGHAAGRAAGQRADLGQRGVGTNRGAIR